MAVIKKEINDHMACCYQCEVIASKAQITESLGFLPDASPDLLDYEPEDVKSCFEWEGVVTGNGKPLAFRIYDWKLGYMPDEHEKVEWNIATPTKEQAEYVKQIITSK